MMSFLPDWTRLNNSAGCFTRDTHADGKVLLVSADELVSALPDLFRFEETLTVHAVLAE